MWQSMYLLTAPRNDRWPDDLEIDFSFNELIDSIMNHIGKMYQLPALTLDRTLRDGIVIHIVPACLQQRFHLWLPAPKPITNLSDRYTFEHKLAHEIVLMVERHTAVIMPPGEINNIALLLRAAFIREKPNRVQKGDRDRKGKTERRG
ncbi:MAG: PRD domain-containing protein, partial [Chloroflexi bacterium]|nr:PRD domain-containing protein [Chloroflexota bacterium]